MDAKSLKTSWKQRVAIMIIAILMLGSVMLTYILIVLNGTANPSSSQTNNAKLAALQEQYSAKSAEITDASLPLSEKYFNDFVKYKSEIKAYNSAAANSDGLKTADLKEGTGRTLAEGDTDYYTYYIGWCADGSIFDSSFDDSENPTRLKAPLDASIGLIEGWNQGVIGMKIGGVRQIAMSGSLAYQDQNQVCGGQPDTPLKFIVLALEPDANIKKLNDELSEIRQQMMMLYYSGASTSGAGL